MKWSVIYWVVLYFTMENLERVYMSVLHLCTHLSQLLLEPQHLGGGVGDSREDVREEAVEERNVLSHQLGHHRLHDALDQDLSGCGG